MRLCGTGVCAADVARFRRRGPGLGAPGLPLPGAALRRGAGSHGPARGSVVGLRQRLAILPEQPPRLDGATSKWPLTAEVQLPVYYRFPDHKPADEGHNGHMACNRPDSCLLARIIFGWVALWGAAAVSPLCAQAPPEQSPPRPCNNAANCNAVGTTALQAGNFKVAIEDFFEELRDAEASYSGPAVLALNNLSVAYLHQRDLLEARFWARQALAMDRESTAAIHNLSVIDTNLRSFTWPASPDGSYATWVGCSERNKIRISNASASRAELSFRGLRIGTRGCDSHFPAAIGELDGEIALRGESALYHGSGETASCKIHLQFQRTSVSVEEEGQCGFGAGVHIRGEYQRVSVQ